MNRHGGGNARVVLHQVNQVSSTSRSLQTTERELSAVCFAQTLLYLLLFPSLFQDLLAS
jgi:hypothetical protein